MNQFASALSKFHMENKTDGRKNRRVMSDEEHAKHFWNQVEKTDSCWLWKKAKTESGYGVFRRGNATNYAHRYSYTLTKGAIPDGYEVDHLCRVRGCVNPEHLEAVTPKENWRRGTSPSAISIATNKCIRGHEFSDENTYIRPDNGQRGCLTCRHDNWRRWYAENGAEKNKKDYQRKIAQSKSMEAV